MSITTAAAKRGRILGSAAVTWLVFAAALLLWELIAIGADSVYFPRMTEIVATGADVLLSGPAWRLMLGDAVFDIVLPSLATALGAWALSALIGVALGTALGRSSWAMDYCGTLISFLRSVPPVTLMPAFMVMFGIGVQMEIAAIVFSTLWPIVLNTVDGVRSVDQVKTDTARSLGTPRRYWIGMIVLPAAMPKIFAGLRLSLSIAILLMVVAEIVGGSGIGLRLSTTQSTVQYPEMWFWVLLLGVLGYALNSALLAVERLVLGWQPTRGDDA
ncbi:MULTISPECIES: ABC transporter permease [Prauserella salsuginis group]|uniref:ABC-type nitrate/sulfonate/bicarbonate transport system permease component n=2 Tax=Prauserella salsuginis group TaxID=2893672 RepID=A0A839XHJ5_9PSEU|nr:MULTISPECIES: ABC transporter permease [Prauserella salsuginis group]MBB3663442.1 ABC-type nitrate/sulfonate/bicarbonate transport system permease component [Prauserella sediminis]MCR3720738.1 ABC-type nitrate/sulfonate/bicarbonate transport system, permease component [Prauserella flava]MCR3735181.1 ABC-type nitrate/sulfonate/bicarbonate transport system, permease component [Prauserella salsuginis]